LKKCIKSNFSDQVGHSEAQSICCRTHLGHLLNPGDLVLGQSKKVNNLISNICLGYNVWESNLNNRVFDTVKEEKVPDVVS
jgi:hypothetical protein